MKNEVLNNKESRLSIYLFIIAIIAGVFSIVLGMVVLVGWYTGNKALVQVMPTFVPMQYNTALGFVLCGSGMLSEIFIRRRYIAIILGALVIILGSLTLLEYIMALNFGIDELLMKHNITVKTSHPGRMAPNTAVCFILISSIMVFPVLFKQRISQSLLKVTLTSFAFGLSVVAFSGYLTHIETAYGWGKFTQMALHTSVGFVVISNGFLALSWFNNINNETRVPRWLPVPIAIGALTVTVCFWQVLHSGNDLLNNALLIIGIIYSIALSLMVYFAMASSRRTKETVRANKDLAAEIDEHKRTGEFLRRYEFIINTSRDMSSLINKDSIYEAVNEAYCNNVCRDRQDIIGHKVADVWSERAFRAVIKPNLDRCLAGEEVNYQAWLDIPQLGQQYFNITYYPYYDSNDKASHAVVILHNITECKRDEETLHQQVQQLTVLNRLIQQISTNLSLDKLVQVALDTITDIVHPDLALFFLRDGDNLILQGNSFTNSKYCHGETPIHRVGECLCGLSVAEGKSLYSSDLLRDKRCTWEECKKAGLRSFAAIPMHSRDEIIGVLGVAFGTQHEYDNQSEFLETVTHSISTGLQNTLLHMQEQHHAEELETKVEERTILLSEANASLEMRIMENERFNHVFVEREFRIKELRDYIKKLEG